MFRRINRLKNIGKFEQLTSGSGNQSEFSKYNVIYARNASGKSTLCDIFRSLGLKNPAYIAGRKRFGVTGDAEIEFLFLGTPAPKATGNSSGWTIEPAAHQVPPIHVFDERFVAENVFIGAFTDVEHRRNLYGLVLGERGRMLKQRVDEAEEALTAAGNVLSTATSGLQRHLPSGLTVEQFKSLPPVDNVDQLISQTETDLENARRRQTNADRITQRAELPDFETPQLPATELRAMLQNTPDAAVVEAESKVRNHLHQRKQPLPLEWAAQGQQSQMEDLCPYCGQDMSSTALLNAYRAFFSGELRQQEEARKHVRRTLELRFGESARNLLAGVFVRHRTEIEWWHDAVATAIDLPMPLTAEVLIAKMAAAFEAANAAIERKKESPSTQVSLSEPEEQALQAWDEAVQALNQIRASVGAANIRIRQIKASTTGADVTTLTQRLARLKNQKVRHSDAAVQALAAFDSATTGKAQKEIEKTRANAELRQQSQQIFDQYGGKINEILERFGVDFRLGTRPIAFHGGPPAGDLAIELLGSTVSMSLRDMRDPARPSLANTLSGGDRSAIGLAYFLAMVLHDPNLANSIVVFDDPFHSQDRSRRQRTLEWVQRVARDACQCFVLSHELDFAHGAARCHHTPGRTFMFAETGRHPVLSGEDLPDGPGSTYDEDYKTLQDFSSSPRGDQVKFRAVARCIRQTLEYYLRVKFSGHFQPTEWLGDMISKLRDATSGPLTSGKHLVGDLTEVNEWGKRFYHSEDASAASVIDPAEMKSYVDQTLRIIFA